MINLNKLSPLLDNEPVSNRAKLDTGTLCNYKCTFCYYKDKLDICDSFDVIKERIDYLVKCKIKEVDLSGGESSYHPDWFKILNYCTLNNLYISTISNGSMFNDYEFLKKSKEHGLKEIMFSLHGSNSKVHDKIVQSENAFNSLIESINNAKKLNITIRINYVVTLNSLKFTNEYIELINKIQPLEINFLTLNYFGIANQSLSYEKSTVHIKEIIDNIRVKYINVRYTPYCYMIGYEKYVCNTFQHIYDLFDWNMAVYDYKIEPTEFMKNTINLLYNTAKKDRLNMYFKPKECIDCKFLYLCDGFENKCKDIAQPIKCGSGEKIKEINYFRKSFYEDKYFDINA